MLKEETLMRCPSRTLRALAVASSLMLSQSFPCAAAILARHVSGTVAINQGHAGFIVTAGYGGGVLRYEGRNYHFKIGGLGVGGFGASALQATGYVYDLHSLDDFPGPYVNIRAGVAIGRRSLGGMWLRNPHGVTLKLNAKRRGLMLAAGGDAMVITMVPAP
jgi:hypothetical protein